MLGSRAERVGTNVRATNSDAICEKKVTYASCLNITPDIPRTKISGKKTATEVKVPAMIGAATSVLPSMAAWMLPRPVSRRR